MKYNGFLFKHDTNGNVTVTLCVDRNPITAFTIDDKDCDAFIKTLTTVRKNANKAKR